MAATATLTAGEARTIVDRYRDDPVAWTRDVLGFDTWSTQQRILRALGRPHARVAVRSCHSSGKTAVAAAAVLWFAATGGLVVTTAPTQLQVTKLLWGEVARLHSRARFRLGGELLQTEWKLSNEAFALGFSTNDSVRFQGWHGKRVLVILDEAAGVAASIWEAIEGIRAGGDVRQLAIGNPTIATGEFYRCFTGRGAAGWTRIAIDAFDTPNLVGLTIDDVLAMDDDELGRVERPYLTTRRWVREMYRKWGAEASVYLSRVRGQFPTQSADALIPLSQIDAAASASAVDDGGPLKAGVDVAGPGDDETVVYVVRNGQVLDLLATSGPDPRAEVADFLAKWRDRLWLVNVDAVGLGYYFALHLTDAGFPVQQVIAGATSADPTRWANLKAELYWSAREQFGAGGVAGLTDEETISQLTTMRYQHRADRAVEIEGKDDYRKREGRSPDRAEALILALYPAHGGGSGEWALADSVPARDHW
jgi:hypothetical protein